MIHSAAHYSTQECMLGYYLVVTTCRKRYQCASKRGWEDNLVQTIHVNLKGPENLFCQPASYCEWWTHNILPNNNCYVTWQISIFAFLSAFFSLVYGGCGSVGNIWCHILPCAYQDFATFKSKYDDGCGAVCLCCKNTVNHMWSNHSPDEAE